MACHHGREHKKVVSSRVGMCSFFVKKRYRTYTTCPFNRSAHQQTYNAGRGEYRHLDEQDFGSQISTIL